MKNPIATASVDREAYSHQTVKDYVKKQLATAIIKEMPIDVLELLFDFEVGEHLEITESSRDNLLFECKLIYSIEDLKQLKELGSTG